MLEFAYLLFTSQMVGFRRIIIIQILNYINARYTLLTILFHPNFDNISTTYRRDIHCI